jgi:3-oxoacyl-[acyl-carrier protein] reductase
MSAFCSLAGKTALITGSSTGIGRAIAELFAELDATVIIHGRTESNELLACRNSILSAGGVCHLLAEDFADANCFESFVDQAWRANNGIEICVNNAGGDVLTEQAADWPFMRKLNYLLQVDVTATLIVSRMLGEKMSSRSIELNRPAGSCAIINIGWDQAWQGMAGDSGELFSASKGAVMAMTLSLAQSFAPHVRVNCLAPGWIRTDWGWRASESWTRRAVSESLMSRWGNPGDVANAAAFLASSQSSFISGQVLFINGGRRFHGWDEP